jgi:signal transduction histidine kinase
MPPAQKVTLEVDTRRATEAVCLPEDSLRQVLYNIIVNAIEASPEGGVVRVSATVEDEVLQVLVGDQGAGIPEAERSRIYEPFFTTKSLTGTGGLGLGLSISRGIVQAMQGTLDFERPDEGGTEFRIRIPARCQEVPVHHA